MSEGRTFEQIFAEHASRWRRQTSSFSSARKKATHPDYQAIVDLGDKAVPLILKELRDWGGHWFWALTAITGDNPVPNDAAGNVRRMRESWLRWGEERGLL